MSAPAFRPHFCKAKALLEKQFDAAVGELMELHKAEITVRMARKDSERFELAIKLAQKKREEAKRRLLAHVQTHGCFEVE